MGQETKKIYLYLGRRDKKGVAILSVLHGPSVPPSRVPDIARLGLPRDLTARLKQSIHEERMYWEPWIEAADTYTDLVESLKKRGYTNVPVNPIITHRVGGSEKTNHNVKTVDATKHDPRTISQRITTRKTMLR